MPDDDKKMYALTKPREAMVDDISLTNVEHGGDPVELTEDQVKRLRAAGAKLKGVEDDEGQTSEDYGDMTNEQLQDELRERELPVSGAKPELVQRLKDDDAAKEDDA